MAAGGLSSKKLLGCDSLAEVMIAWAREETAKTEKWMDWYIFLQIDQQHAPLRLDGKGGITDDS